MFGRTLFEDTEEDYEVPEPVYAAEDIAVLREHCSGCEKCQSDAMCIVYCKILSSIQRKYRS